MKKFSILLFTLLASGCAAPYKPEGITSISPTLKIHGDISYGTGYGYYVLPEPCVTDTELYLGSVGGSLLDNSEQLITLKENKTLVIKVVNSVHYTTEVYTYTSYFELTPEQQKSYELQKLRLTYLDSTSIPNSYKRLPVDFCSDYPEK